MDQVKCGSCVETKLQKIKRKIRWIFSEASLFSLLSDKRGGNETMPLDRNVYRVLEKQYKNHPDMAEVIMFTNDGGEISFGYPDKWHHTYSRKIFNKLIIWYIWQCIWGDWLGLRSWIWYKLLTRRCRGYKLNK